MGIHETRILQQHKLVKKDFESVKRDIGQIKFTSKTYVIIIKSEDALFYALQKLRESVLWDYKGFFLVVNRNLNTGCDEARNFLHMVWFFNVLSAVMLCSNKKGEIQIFTFNPYNDFAPQFWNLIQSKDLQNNHTWRLFERKLETTHFSSRKYIYLRPASTTSYIIITTIIFIFFCRNECYFL